MSRDYKLYLRDMLKASQRIRTYKQGKTLAEFQNIIPSLMAELETVLKNEEGPE